MGTKEGNMGTWYGNLRTDGWEQGRRTVGVPVPWSLTVIEAVFVWRWRTVKRPPCTLRAMIDGLSSGWLTFRCTSSSQWMHNACKILAVSTHFAWVLVRTLLSQPKYYVCIISGSVPLECRLCTMYILLKLSLVLKLVFCLRISYFLIFQLISPVWILGNLLITFSVIYV